MSSTVDQHLIKISMGQIPIDKKLKLSEDVKLFVSGNITKVEQKDNQNGTFDEVYTIKGIVADALVDEELVTKESEEKVSLEDWDL